MSGQAPSLSFLLIPWFLTGLLSGFLATTSLYAPSAALLRTEAPSVLSRNESALRLFSADAAILVNYVKPDKAADFEATVMRLKEALGRSASAERREQAAGWRVFRAVEPATNGDVVYIFEIYPAVKGADYTISRILNEAFPSEAHTLYQRYANSHSVGRNVVNLTLISAFGEGPRE
jgi:hypothetical protein